MRNYSSEKKTRTRKRRRKKPGMSEGDEETRTGEVKEAKRM